MPTAFPPKVRAIVYWVYLALALITGSAQVFYMTTDYNAPPWFYGVVAVVTFLGSGFAGTAASHVVTKTSKGVDASQPESGNPPALRAES